MSKTKSIHELNYICCSEEVNKKTNVEEYIGQAFLFCDPQCGSAMSFTSVAYLKNKYIRSSEVLVSKPNE